MLNQRLRSSFKKKNYILLKIKIYESDNDKMKIDDDENVDMDQSDDFRSNYKIKKVKFRIN